MSAGCEGKNKGRGENWNVLISKRAIDRQLEYPLSLVLSTVQACNCPVFRQPTMCLGGVTIGLVPTTDTRPMIIDEPPIVRRCRSLCNNVFHVPIHRACSSQFYRDVKLQTSQEAINLIFLDCPLLPSGPAACFGKPQSSFASVRCIPRGQNRPLR